MKLSVILCTHNPRADYLGRTLAALEAQSLPKDDWELLVVDNRSDEPLSGRLDLSWHPNARIVREEKLGLTPARLRGLADAKGELLVLVDDDNVLDPDYLEQARRIAETRPYLGAWSGQTRGSFEQTPPEWSRRYWGNLAIREFDTDVWSNLPRSTETMPCGAGLCLRREVGQRYIQLHDEGERRFQFDRTGDSLVSGGDNDLAACACDIGLGVGLFSALKLQHLIPPGRLTVDYLARLAEGITFSSLLLDHQRGLPAPQRHFLGVVADKIRVLLAGQPHATILKASHRGRDRAINIIAEHQP